MSGTPALVRAYDEMLELEVSLPEGWQVTSDPAARTLTAVAGEGLEVGDFRPSVVLQCRDGLPQGRLAELGRLTLADMSAGYAAFEVAWQREEQDRLLRAYDFEPAGLGHRVRQVQGLVAGASLVIVNATRLSEGPDLDEMFAAVIGSVRA